MNELQGPTLREEGSIRQHIDSLERRAMAEAEKRILALEPERTREEISFAESLPIRDQILHESGEQKEISEARQRLKELVMKRYRFTEDDRMDVSVGKEGTLIYSLRSGGEAAHDLARSLVLIRDEHGIQDRDRSWDPYIADVQKRIQDAKVADLHQIEVLPQYQGKGIATALLDVALTDIDSEHGDVQFYLARVMENNPDGEKMIRIFKRAGFEALYVPEAAWDDPRAFTLLIRENSRLRPVNAVLAPKNKVQATEKR